MALTLVIYDLRGQTRGLYLRDTALEAVEYAACLADRRRVRTVRAFFNLFGEQAAAGRAPGRAKLLYGSVSRHCER